MKEIASPGDAVQSTTSSPKLSASNRSSSLRDRREDTAGAGPRRRITGEAEARDCSIALNQGHDFELPPTLVENEFNAIWSQFTHDLEHHKRSFEDEGTTEEKARTEYRDIASRRVRLGLVLSGDRPKLRRSRSPTTR